MQHRARIAFALLLCTAGCSGSSVDATPDAGVPMLTTGGTPVPIGGRPAPMVDAAMMMQQTGGKPAVVDAAVDAAMAAPDAAVMMPLPPPVTFDPAPGTFTDPFTLTLKPTPTRTEQDRYTELYYTLDGSLPTNTSMRYTAPLSLQTTTLVRVAAYLDGALVERQSASYIQLGADVAAFDSNLPLVIVHMLDMSVPNAFSDEYQPAIAQVHDRAANGRATLTNPPSLDARVAIKVHGRSTRAQLKSSYSLEIRDQADEDDEQAHVLDMPPQSDWVLYAPYDVDRALVRDAFFYQLSNAIGRYAPRTRFVEMYLADAGQPVDKSKYVGVYVVTETIKRDPDRVPVKKLKDTDSALPEISGGYIVRVDEAEEDELSWAITGIPDDVMLRYPDEDKVNAAQSTYLKDYLDSTGRAMAAADRIDPMTQRAVSDLVDLDSFIDHHILNVFAKNPDAFRLSAYMWKDRDQKLFAGPVWDCDRCMGSYDGRDEDPEGWLATLDGTNYFEYGWWRGLFADDAFEDRYWQRFSALLAGPLATTAMLPAIDALASQLDEAAARNAERYPFAEPEGGMFRNEIDKLKTWIDKRATWVKANVGER